MKIRSFILLVEKIPHEPKKSGKLAWGNKGNLPTDYSKYKHEPLKGDSSSTSHLVDSAESSASQPPPVPNRPSPLLNRHAPTNQPPPNVSIPYRHASALSEVRVPPPPTRSYSPDPDDIDDHDSNLNTAPLTANRPRTTPFGSRKSLSESIQSLRSNTQPALTLPTKKRPQESAPPPMVPKRDQRTPSPRSFEIQKDYQHHHYHNPAQMRAQQKQQTADNDVSSEDEELQQRLNNLNEDSVVSQMSKRDSLTSTERLSFERTLID